MDRCLAKDPAARYPDASALRADLVAAHARLTRPPEAAWRRPAVLVPVALVLIASRLRRAWQTMQARRARWAREQAIPEIERIRNEHLVRAVRLARDAERYAPEDVARVRLPWYRLRLETESGGRRRVEMKDYLDLDGPWQPFGPHADRRCAGAVRVLPVRIAKAGYVPLEISSRHARASADCTDA